MTCCLLFNTASTSLFDSGPPLSSAAVFSEKALVKVAVYGGGHNEPENRVKEGGRCRAGTEGLSVWTAARLHSECIHQLSLSAVHFSLSGSVSLSVCSDADIYTIIGQWRNTVQDSIVQINDDVLQANNNH